MLKAKLFSSRLKNTLVATGITGEITAHNQAVNKMAIRQLLKLDPYFMFDIQVVKQAVKAGLSEDQVRTVMAQALGISPGRFVQEGPSYIDPELTIHRLEQMLDAVDQTIAAGRLILLATAHPGSMLKFYLTLENYIQRHRGRLFELAASIPLPRHQWADSVGGVVVISDLGSLLHDHGGQAVEAVLGQVPGPQIGLVIADHGMAGAAINAHIKTVGLHDVDDPGIPLAAHLGADVLAVPMNDNQLNLRTDHALTALIGDRD